MPDPALAPAARQEPQSGFKTFLDYAQKAILIYIVSQFAGQFLSSKLPSAKPPVPTPGVPAANIDPNVQAATQINPFALPPQTVHPAWPVGSEMELHFYMSASPYPNAVFTEQGRREGLPKVIWDNITLGDWKDENRLVQFNVDIPVTVQKNASALFGHVFITKDHASPDPSNPKFNAEAVHHFTKVLTRYLPKLKVRKEKNLLSSKEEQEQEEQELAQLPDIIVPHWHPNLTLTIISDQPAIPYAKLPPVVQQYVRPLPDKRDETGTQGFYPPVIFTNDFWQLRSQLVEINSTTPTLPFQLSFYPISYTKFQIYATLTAGFEEAGKQAGGGTGSAELDEIKRMLVETNPYLLVLTAVVSLLHMVFEFLAFSSDVSHWRNKKEMVGVSVRTIITNVFVQLVILLYLLDNNADTSWMIVLGQGMGMVIEAWKVTKAIDFKFLPAPPGSWFPYRVEFHDKHVLSEDEKKTQQYDREAFRYVSYVAIPLLGGYSIYSLMYESHRGWYSFTISTLTSFVYMFGFAQLIPQLIINYKLKSVAHMPMKAMVFKTLSTVVDDFFAFCIKMPFLHRLACFRDDVVFLIFLYQRWIYRVDPTRVNEYGQVLSPEEQKAAEEKKKK
ncbi:hypothetical protein M422DRAFT_62579 [Sphaerobolus stellatus SS14]|nr:hypothetical protein M422DRAFT_62579 [Sphaerobolus stellatus SS14]